MATLHITNADRDERGRIKIEPRTLADLLPQPEAIRQDAQRIVRTMPTKHEYAALAALALLAAFVLVWTWQTPQLAPAARVMPLPTAYVAPPPTLAPPLPTMTPAPTAAPVVLPVIAPVQSAPSTLSVMDAPPAQQDTAPAIIPEDLVQLNDPAQNGNSVAPPGCPFPIINGICGNGARAKDVPDVPPRDGTKSSK